MSTGQAAVLRPAFTRDLAERLQHGAAINLVSPHGQGRRRTLADLSTCLPAAMAVLQANLRAYPHSLASMLADLSTQAGLPAMPSLTALLETLERRRDTLIVLHNLDELAYGEASGFDAAFFAGLNGVGERSGLSLLCVSERVPEAWPLDIAALMLPPLNEEQILAEMTRRNPPFEAAAWPGIARWMAERCNPYALLERPQDWPSA